MDKIYSFIPKKTFILAIGLFFGIIILGPVLLIGRSEDTTLPSNPVISQSPTNLSPLQKSIAGKTTINEITKTYPNTREEILPNGDSRYSLESGLDARPNQIDFKNRVASFERIVLIGGDYSNILKISDLILKYGAAERIIKGSRFYGDHMENHLYPSKGLIFIGNPNTNEVFEIQTFTPTTIENYLSTYGEDISYSENREVKE